MTTIKPKGFTLIEVMVALAIFATVSVVAIGGIQSIMQGKGVQRQIEQDLRAAQMTHALFKSDLMQVINRPIRDEDNSIISAFLGMPVDGSAMSQAQEQQVLTEFTRAGVANPNFKENRSTLLRVQYQLHHHKLYRTTWRALDRAPSAQTQSRLLLSDVKSLEIKYIDHLKAEQPSWLLSKSGVNVDLSSGLKVNSMLPAAMHVLVTTNKNQYSWYFLLPGGRSLARS